MGRTVYWMNVSMDLRIEHADGEKGEGTWLSIDEELHREFNRRARALSLMIQGRVVYEIMEGFWPGAATREEEPDFVREYGAIWTNMPKVLVSRSRTDVRYNTRAIGSSGNTIEELAAIRAETSGDIGIGGATLATELLEAGLLDELLLFMHPVVLGRGRPLFDRLERELPTELLELQRFSSGVTLLRSAVKRT